MAVWILNVRYCTVNGRAEQINVLLYSKVKSALKARNFLKLFR